MTTASALHIIPKSVGETFRRAWRPRIEGLHSEGIFKVILKHERAMSERANQDITVLAFCAPVKPMGTHAAHLLSRTFADRLRATDVAGWLDSRKIGVILPNTRVKYATRVAEQISSRMATHGIRLKHEFYLSPRDEGDASNGQMELPLPLRVAGATAEGPEQERPCCEARRSPWLGEAAVDAGDRLSTHPFAELCVSPLPAWKRGLDILLCLMALAVFGVVMALIAIGIKMVSPGPVLFRQKRIGFRGRPFVLYKFRSMNLNADTGVHQEHLVQLMHSNASMTKLDQADARLIPCGKLFRASGLDELPQLFNIIRGDMSFIGPRPCVPYEYERFNEWHKRRCDTYPGLTGLWQVSGKNRTTFTEMMRLDITYGRRQTLTQDLMILALTIPAVFRQIWETTSMNR